MNALLVRVGADSSPGGGSWNSPVDTKTGRFVYAAIPETRPVHPGMERPYADLEPLLFKSGIRLPAHLRLQHMHLDPDFKYLTYGDQGERAKQLARKLGKGDIVALYAGLADLRGGQRLIYAIIGLFTVADLIPATSVTVEARDTNAHSRRVLADSAQDLIVRGQPGMSGRLERCLPIGEWRDRAYRVRPDLLQKWGGLSAKDDTFSVAQDCRSFLTLVDSGDGLNRRSRRFFKQTIELMNVTHLCL